MHGQVASPVRILGWRRFAAACRGTVTASSPGIKQMADAKHFDDQFRPLLVRYCVACHGGDKPKGKLRLDNLTTDFADAATRDHWTAVIERLKAGEMPPKGKPRPPAQDVQALTGWLAPRVAAADAAAARPLRDGWSSAGSIGSSTRTPSATCWASTSI